MMPLLALLLPWAPLRQAEPPVPVRATPAFEGLMPNLSLPPTLEDRLLYYNSLDTEDGRPQIDTASAQQPGPLATGPGGMRGGCALAKQGQVLQLSSEAFSPHRPLTVAFWWALGEDGQIDSTFGLFHLTNGKGFVSHFSRGKGQWCALEQPAAVLQVYHLPTVANVNGIYDRDLAAHVELNAGVWHHTAIVFQGASLVEVYTDGARAWQTRLKGRPFSPDDGLHDLTVGSRHGLPMALDEVLILGRALTAEETGEYVTAVRQMEAVGYPW
jgi:hypothetical protein